MGPVPYFNPSIAEKDCAAVFFPKHLAVSPDGVYLVGLDHGLARVDVRALITPMGSTGTKEGTKEETKAQGASRPLGLTGRQGWDNLIVIFVSIVLS